MGLCGSVVVYNGITCESVRCQTSKGRMDSILTTHAEFFLENFEVNECCGLDDQVNSCPSTLGIRSLVCGVAWCTCELASFSVFGAVLSSAAGR